MRRLFTLRLADVSNVGQPVRRARKSEIVKDGEAEWRIAEQLADSQRRLLTISNPGPVDDPIVEVAHEQLLQRWKTLRGWLDEERDFLIWRLDAARDAQDYAKATDDKKTDALLTGLPTRAREWHGKRASDMGDALRQFVEASIAHGQVRQRLTKLVTAITTVLALAAGGFWWSAENNSKQATAERDRALFAQSRLLDKLSHGRTTEGNATDGALLALEALSTIRTHSPSLPYLPEAEASLYFSLQNLHELKILPHDTSRV